MIFKRIVVLVGVLFSFITLNSQNLYPSLFDQSGGISNGYGAWGANNYIEEASIDVASKGVIKFYHPDIAVSQRPTVFFISGWGEPYTTYDKYFKYIASLGYSVVNIYNYNPGSINTSYQNSIDMMQQAVATYTNWIDTTKVGLSGHSYGAGSTIWIGKQVFDANGLNWGSNGRFIIIFQPWLSFLMNDTDLQNYPSNVKLLVLQSYDEVNSSAPPAYLTDTRAVRAMYQLISIPDTDKDCATLFSDNDVAHQYNYNGSTFSYLANHYICYTDLVNGDRNPYDALDVYAVNRLTNAMTDYVFEGNAAAKDVALGNGSASQIDMGILPSLAVTDYYIENRPESDFEYKCSENQPGTWGSPDIWFLSNYCDDLDNDGHIDNVALVNQESFNNKLSLYPIPSTAFLNIRFNNGYQEILNYKIVDVLGNVIESVDKPQTYVVDISSLVRGTYFIKVATSNTNYTKQFIVK